MVHKEETEDRGLGVENRLRWYAKNGGDLAPSLSFLD